MANTYRAARSTNRRTHSTARKVAPGKGEYRAVLTTSRDMVCEAGSCPLPGQLTPFKRVEPLLWPVLCEVHAKAC